MKAKANIIKDGQFYRQGDEIWELGSWVATEVYGNLQAVCTTVDTAGELWNLIPRRPFVILGIRGGSNLFGRNGNYVGMLYIINGVITGVMIDHWTGSLYTAIGSTYGDSDDIHFNPVLNTND